MVLLKEEADTQKYIFNILTFIEGRDGDSFFPTEPFIGLVIISQRIFLSSCSIQYKGKCVTLGIYQHYKFVYFGSISLQGL